MGVPPNYPFVISFSITIQLLGYPHFKTPPFLYIFVIQGPGIYQLTIPGVHIRHSILVKQIQRSRRSTTYLGAIPPKKTSINRHVSAVSTLNYHRKKHTFMVQTF